jgi:uncharacterized protein (DUF1778 family)
MPQLTLRIPERLGEELKSAAHARGESLNRFATAVLRAAVDPAFAGDEAEVLRERLARAGLLAVAEPSTRARPSRKAVARARSTAGRGRSLSKLVSEGRG